MKRQLTAFCGSETLGKQVKLADGFLTRLRGLLFTNGLRPGEGLLLRPCSSIHTMGMRYDIDVLFLSKTGEVLRVEEHMRPGRLGIAVRGAWEVLELKSGEAAVHNIHPGNIVWFEDTPSGDKASA